MTTAAPKAKPRRLRRWLVRLVVLAIVLRLALALALPWLVERALGFAGFAGSCAAASLSLGGASVHLHGLRLRDPSQPNGLTLSAQEAIADLSTWQLLHGRIAISNILLSGPHLDVWTRSDGSFVLPAAGSPTATPSPAAAPTASTPPNWSLEPPIAIATARLHDLRLRVFGPDGDTPRQTYVLDASLLDLGRTDMPCTFELRFANPAHVDTLRLDGSLTTAPDRAELDWTLTVRGLAAAPLLGAGIVRDEPLALTASGDLVATRDTAGAIALHAEASLRGPGIADELAFSARGTLRADGSADIAADARMHRLALHAFTPLLDGLGVRLPPDGLDAEAAIATQRAGDGALSMQLTNLALRGGGQSITWPELSIADLTARDGEVTAQRLGSNGPVASIHRTADGALTCCGVRWQPPTALPAAQTDTAAPAAATRAASLRIHLADLDCTGLSVQYSEDTPAGVRSLVLDGAALRGEAIAVGPDAATGRIGIDLPMPDVAHAFHVDVHGKPSPGGIAAEVAVTADGIGLRRLAPWLLPLGIQSTFVDGTLRANCAIDASLGDEPSVGLHVANVRLADGDTVWLGLRDATITGLHAVAGGAIWQTCTIDEPVLRLVRDPAGTTVAGLRFAPHPTTAGATDGSPPPDAPPVATATTLSTGPVTLRGATVLLADPEAQATHAIGLDGSVGAFAAGAPVPFAFGLRLEQQLERLAVTGTIAHTGPRVEVDATLTGTGIRGSALSPWLPAGLACTLRDGGLAGHLHAVLTGGDTTTAELLADDIALRDGDTELAAIDRVAVRAPALGRDLVHLASVRVEGVRAAVAATDQGVAVPGFRLEPPPPAFVPPGGGPDQPPKPAAAVATPLPQLRLDELVLACERLDYRDRRGGEGVPLHATARLELAAPWATAADVEESPPLQLKLAGSAAPVVAAVTGTVDVSPFRLRPELTAALQVHGIDTTALPTVLPTLAGSVRGTEADLAIDLRARLALDLHRTEPSHFDLSRAFGLEAEITDLAVTDGTGTSLATVPDLVVIADAIDPRSGDVFLRRVEIDSPTVSLRREADGLHTLGIVVAAPAATAAAPAATPAAGPTPETSTKGPEFALGQLIVRGLACEVSDTTTTPPTHAPIEELDLTVHGLTTLATAEPRPVAFSLQVRGGDVELERRIARSSLVAGMLGSTGRLIAGERDEHEKERRPLVEELTASGNLLLFPRPKGTVRARVRGFELPALRGLAKPSGVDIADGLFDGSVALDLQPTTARVKSLAAFRFLSITEPPGGPISTYLRLPAPLDTVLFVLRNADGEQRLPLQFEAPTTGDPTTQITQAAVEALTLLIADAIGSAPTRVLTTFTHALGLGGEDDLAARTTTVAFAAGSATADFAAATALAAALAADASVHFEVVHELGADDVPAAARLANPEPAVVRAAVARLRTTIAEAEQRRAALAPEVAARFLAGQPQVAEPLRRELRRQDDAIGEAQATLAAALGQLQEDGDRARARRTRDGCLELGQGRLQAARAALLDVLGPAAEARIEVREPRRTPVDGIATGRVVVRPIRLRG